MEESKVSAIVRINQKKIEGFYANSFKLRAKGEETRIDFIYLDDETLNPETMEIQGKVVARINMTGETLRDLAKVISKVCSKEYGNAE